MEQTVTSRWVLNEHLVGDIQLFFSLFFKKVSKGGYSKKKNEEGKDQNNNDNNTTKVSQGGHSKKKDKKGKDQNNNENKSNKQYWSWQDQKEEIGKFVAINATADRSEDHGENLQSEMHWNK